MGWNPGYRRQYGGGAQKPRKFLVGSYSALADAATGNIAINCPVGGNQGIEILGIEVEFSDGTWFVVDNKSLSIVVARTSGTAERYINDPDVIFKTKLHSELATNGAILHEQVIERDIYPGVPHIGPQLHVTITNSTGAVQTVYAKIWYRDYFVSMQQAVGLLQSQVIG